MEIEKRIRRNGAAAMECRGWSTHRTATIEILWFYDNGLSVLHVHREQVKKEAPHALINVWCSGYYFDENNPKLKAGRVICVSPLSEAEILAAPETTT